MYMNVRVALHLFQVSSSYSPIPNHDDDLPPLGTGDNENTTMNSPTPYPSYLNIFILKQANPWVLQVLRYRLISASAPNIFKNGWRDRRCETLRLHERSETMKEYGIRLEHIN